MTAGTLETALGLVDSDRKQRILSRLEAWAAVPPGEIFVANLFREQFLPVADMLAIIDKLLATSLDKIVEVYESSCLDHVLCGEVIASSTVPSIVGRAVEFPIFVDQLALRTGWPLALAKAYVDDLCAGKFSTNLELEVSMSTYAAWVTWSTDSEDLDPFYFYKANADFVRACLGLARSMLLPADALLLLRYKKPDILYKPTVADAGGFIAFRPTLKDQAHGWTKCWEDFEPVPISRPEGLHEPINFSHLDGAPEKIR